MLSLTGTPIFVIAVVAAVLSLIAVAWLAGGGGAASRRSSMLTRVLPTVGLVLCAQVFAMAALALRVNDQYLFYTSWADLTGQVAQTASIQTGGLVGRGQGTVRVMKVPVRGAGTEHGVLVWLPPEYDLPAYRTHRFPVVMFLTGQPSTPQTAFAHFQFARTAMHVIKARQAPPFVAVFPTLMVSPPRDTECTDVPGGPNAETWLARDVPGFMARTFRVEDPGKAWTAMGWSTGGFCAAKLVTSHPAAFGSGVSFGGYYQPVQDATTGNLFGGQKALEQRNSPAWLYTRYRGLRGSRMLLIAGRQDKQTWASTSQMLQTAAGDPAVDNISFPQGGHNYRNYSSYLAASLAWSAKAWPTGGKP